MYRNFSRMSHCASVASVSIFMVFVAMVHGEACNFPAVWQQYQYLDRIDEQDVKYLVDYNASYASEHNTGNEDKIVYSCEDSYSSDGFLYHNLIDVSTGQYTCVEAYDAAISILYGELPLNPSQPVTGQDCSTMLNSVDIKWRTKFPVIDGITVPFPAARYQLAVSSTPGTVSCIADTDSYIEVIGAQNDELKIQSCSGSTTFPNHPVKCMGTAPGSLLGAPEQGDLMLLAQINDDQGRLLPVPLLYCAWFKVTGGQVQISVDLADPKVMSCNRTGTYDTVIPGTTTAFILTDPSVPSCQIPSFLSQTPTKWWYGYDATGNAVQLTVSEAAMTTTVGTQTIQTAMCQSFYSSVPENYYYQLFDGNPGVLCRDYLQVEETGNCILTRELSGAAPSTFVPETSLAVQCAAAMATINDYRVILKDGADFSSVQCPFEAGLYETVYSEDGHTFGCVNVHPSHITVEGGTLNFETCMTTNTYEQPLMTQLQCISSWPAGKVDPALSEDGDFLVMARTNPSTNNLEYYCARYKRQPILNVNAYTLSLNIQSASDMYCKSTGTSTSAGTVDGAKYIHFIMTERTHASTVSLDETTSDSDTTVSTSTVATSSSDSTTAGSSDCECLNGGTCADSTQPRVCSCPDETTGVLCENRLEGCYVRPCLNNGTCIDGNLGSSSCRCPEGYSGDQCQLIYDGPTESTTIMDSRFTLALCLSLAILIIICLIIGIFLCCRNLDDSKEESSPPMQDEQPPTSDLIVNTWLPEAPPMGGPMQHILPEPAPMFRVQVPPTMAKDHVYSINLQ